MKTSKTVQKIYQSARESRDDSGRAWLATKDVAALIRHRLRVAFPGVKFSVRAKVYSGGSSVHIYWSDGPVDFEVEQVANAYSFGGFDGMIDLKYHNDNWLLPDGSMDPAWSPGTERSGGSYPNYATDCPAPGAVMVSGGPDHVFAYRRISEQHKQRLMVEAGRRYGFDHNEYSDESRDFVPGMNASAWMLAVKLEAQTRREELEKNEQATA